MSDDPPQDQDLFLQGMPASPPAQRKGKGTSQPRKDNLGKKRTGG